MDACCWRWPLLWPDGLDVFRFRRRFLRYLTPDQHFFTEIPQVMTSWIIWALLIMYKDQKWRKTCSQKS